MVPKVGPKLLEHRIHASLFSVILTGSFPKGFTSVNRKDWLSAMALVEAAEQRNKHSSRISISSKLFLKNSELVRVVKNHYHIAETPVRNFPVKIKIIIRRFSGKLHKSGYNCSH